MASGSKGQRFDCGSKIGFLKATIAFALEREDLGPEFATYLHSIARASLAAE